jgi:MSHA type pilus biogenesis protein MshL
MWIYKLKTKLKSSFWGKLLVFSLLIFLVSCATKEPELEKASSEFLKKAYGNETKEEIKENSFQTQETQLTPLYKEISPLETKTLTLSFKEENFENVLYFLAKEAGLNLVISPEIYTLIPEGSRKISFQFKNQTLKNILESVLESLNLHYQIKKGILYVVPFEEKTYSLGFLHVTQGSEFKLGGDVLGGEMMMGGYGGVGGVGAGMGTPTIIYTPLKGKYEVKGELEKKQIDIYTQLEESIKALLSDKGIYTLNRLTGTLYVKDRPSHIKMVSKFIEDLKSRYEKQVLIEAKIVEVALNKEHDMGIDWLEIANYSLENRIRLDELTSRFTTRPNEPTIALTITGRPDINLVLNLLKQYGNLNLLSNPRLRVIHGQPALISVGRSVEFVKQIIRELVTAEQVARVQISVTTSSIFDGVLLGVTPYITEGNEILLHVVPIKSDIISLRREDFGQDTSVTLPEVNLREATSIIKVNPGDIIVLGGLILEKESVNEKKIAGFGDIPILGNLFKREQKATQKTELVIIIKVNLV